MRDAIASFSEWRKLQVKESTVTGYDRDLRYLCVYLGNPLVTEITLDRIMEYLNGLADNGWDRNTLIPKTIAMRRFFDFLARQGYDVLDKELIPIPEKKYRLPRVLSEATFRTLLGTIPPRSRDPRHIRNEAIVRLLWDTGARNGEILSINVGDVDTETRSAIIRTEKSKGRRPFRQIFWTPETNGAVERWMRKREHLARLMPAIDPSALFISVAGSVHRTSGRRFTIRGVGEMLRRYSVRAEIPHVNAHSFRHRKGHQIIHEGGSATDVMNILGHSCVQSTSIYTMMTGAELRQRADRFL